MSWVKVYELIQWWCYVVEAFHLKFISFDFVVFFLNFGASQFFPHEPLKSSHTQHLGSLACYLVARFRWLCFMFHNAHTESLRILPLSTLNITVWVQGYKNVKLERWPSSVPPRGTTGTSPSEFFNPQTLWLSTRKFWQRCVWKYPQVVWWCSRFSPLVSWDARGSWTRKSPNTQPLLGWGLELHLGQLIVQLGRGNGILLTLVSTDSPEGEVWLVDQLYPKEKPTKPLALLL